MIEYEQTGMVLVDARDFVMDSPSLFWTRTFNDALVRSLKDNGQLVPVVAVRDGDRPCLLAGQRRVKALEELGRPVLTLFVSQASAFERGIIFLESNAGESLGDGAVIQALRYFAACTDDVTAIAPILGIASHSRQWKLLLAWLDLPVSWDALLVLGHIPLVLGRMLLRFSLEELDMLECVFKKMSWSRNNAVHLVTWIWEASRMQGCTPLALMEQLECNAIMGLELSPKDAMRRILETVRRARYPRLCEQERAFGKRSQEVVAGSGWRLVQPDHFETSFVELSTRISSHKELDARVKELAQIAKNDVWSHLEKSGEEE